MTGEIDPLSRVAPGVPFVMNGGASALSARVAEERSRVLGQESTAEEGRVRADLVRGAKEWGLVWRRQFKVFAPVKTRAQTEDVADTRWALTWKGAEGNETAKARLVEKGYQGPHLRDGDVDIAGCASDPSSHLRSTALGGVNRWRLRGLDI